MISAQRAHVGKVLLSARGHAHKCWGLTLGQVSRGDASQTSTASKRMHMQPWFLHFTLCPEAPCLSALKAPSSLELTRRLQSPPCRECHPLGDPPSLHRRTFGREQSGRVHPVPSWQVTLPGQASSVTSLGLLLCETGSWRGGRILPSGCRCPQSLLLGTAMGSGGKGVALPVLITPRHILLVFAGVGGRETGAEGTSSGTGSFPERSRGWTHRSHLRSQLRGPQLELRRGDRTGLPCCV